MSQIDVFLQRLDKVKQAGQNRFIACCPGHEDKHPSLIVSERDDGSVGIHCFGGCSVHEVVTAVGLDISDLFPPRQHHGKPHSRPFPASDALRCLSFEGMLIASAGRSMLNGTWNEEEQERLVLAVGRINGALTACGVRL